VQGEEQKKLDVIANDVMKRALRWSGKLSTIASEEEDSPISSVLKDEMDNAIFSNDVIVESSGRFTAVFNPLDGSSNIDAGIPVGTIFGIFDQAECELNWEAEDLEAQCLQNTLQPGENLVAAGYCLYSSATTFVFTIGNGVHGFTLDERIGEFVLTHQDITIPSRGKMYSFNEANRWDWDSPLQNYVTDIQQGLVSSTPYVVVTRSG
jgi:fructose-1,6-bisphosphatase I